MSVFCEDCRFCILYVSGTCGYSPARCRKTEHKVLTPERPLTAVKSCEDAGYNRHNECIYYKRKWWKFWAKR